MKNDTQLTISEKDIKQFVKQLKKEEINFFDIPEEYRLHPIIVKAERKLGIRKSDKRGYDIIRGRFFVEEIILTRSSTSEVIERQINNYFLDFASYYEFLEGDIYENACYFQYNFSQMEIDTYDINLNRMNTTALIDITSKDFTIELSVNELQKYNELEKDKLLRKKWIAKFNACNTYEEFQKIISNFNKSKFLRSDLLFFFYNYIFADKDKAFDIIMQYVSDGEYLSYHIERELCYIYGPQKVLAAYNYNRGSKTTIRRHKNRLKEYIRQLENGKVQFRNYSYFDENTHFFCYQVSGYIEKIKSNPIVEIYRYFETFQELAKFLENDLSYCDLSQAILPDIDFSIYKTNEYTKLPIQNPNELTYFLYKGYDRKSDSFVVKQSWLNLNGQTIKEYCNTFSYFFDFIFFLENDLSGADLLFCDGLSNLYDCSNINFTNARLKSRILDRIGMEYQLSTINAISVEDSLSVIKNEEETELILFSKREVYQMEESIKNQKVYYISDLHLLHRIQNASCKSEEDIIYTIQRIIDNLLDKVGFCEKNIILIGGDTSSSFELFRLFIRLLRHSIDEKCLDVHVVFLLGNHELWDFSRHSLEKIVHKYETIISEYKMHLLQNNIIYKDDDNNIQKIGTKELLSVSRKVIREKLITARIILFGGLAFSGYNQEFNANNNIYRDTISRNQEIAESKVFENLYHIVCETLSDKRVIVFTHTPQKDWCSSNEQQSGFIYVSGHTHRNYFYDDGDHRIYEDNQIGYHHENPRLKYFYLEDDYDCFSEYSDGIYKITKEQYINFYRGKNIMMQFTWDVNTLYMLKKNSYYCFIHEALGKQLTILNGGKMKKLDVSDITYYYDGMDTMIEYIKTPLDKFTAIQKQISNEIKAIGGSGTIHGAIIDINFYNHIYVNPYDLSITGYYALDMIHKEVFSSIPELLKAKCPSLYPNYIKYLNEKVKSVFAIDGDGKQELDTLSNVYLDTDIYKASREIKKMQKLSSNILSVWYESV